MFHYEHMHKCTHTHKNNQCIYLYYLFTCVFILQSNVGNRHVNENITFVYYIMRLYAVCCDAGAADIYR